MKQITELSEAEILQLTTDQIQKMILFKMAEAGIKILTKPVEPEYTELPKKTVLLYDVNGISYLFTEKTTAQDEGQALQAASSKMKSSSYVGNDYTHKKVKNLDDNDLKTIGKITEVYLYTTDDAILADEISRSNKQLKTQYETLLSEFKSNENEADYIRVEIWDRIKTVQAKHNNMAEMKYQYDRYLDLSEGNKNIALNFLKKAYSIDEETECFVQGKEYKPVLGDEEYQTTAKSEGQVN